MSDKITLIVRFELQEAVKAEFVSRFKEVFAHIEREESFVGVVRRSFIAASLEDPNLYWFTRCGVKRHTPKNDQTDPEHDHATLPADSVDSTPSSKHAFFSINQMTGHPSQYPPNGKDQNVIKV